MADLFNERREYSFSELDEYNVNSNPFVQFSNWLEEAIKNQETDATAMILSTVSTDLRPSSRVVLLKQFNETGFDFFTNYHSKKALQIQSNPFGSVLFYWPNMERQIRIEGAIIQLSEIESDKYFKSRPRQSQLAAWASPQSSTIRNRKTLIDWFEEFNEIHKDKEIKRPPHWGGYRLVPLLFEFWQGRETRLHDRIEYKLVSNNWKIQRLAP